MREGGIGERGQVYIEELMEPLLKCMARLCSRDTLVYLAYYERSAAATKRFWSLLPRYFAYEKIDDKSYGAAEHGMDVGVFRLRLLENPEAPLPPESGPPPSEAPGEAVGTMPQGSGSVLKDADSQSVQ